MQLREPADRLEQSLVKLEYPEVIEQLARRCHFSVAVELAKELSPAMTHWAAAGLMAVTDEAVQITIDHPGLSVGGARDIRPLLDRAGKGGRLQPQELQDVADTVAAARIIRQQILNTASAAARFPRLVDWATGLLLMPQFEDAVRRSIGPAGEMLDTASEKLARVRREVRIAHQRLFERLNRMISGSAFAGALQDQLVTTRDGRYVIPVKSDSRSQVPGIVHDSSASGQTFFVEPMEVVELNNRWREAQLEERHEIERILSELSAIVGINEDGLVRTVASLAEIDFALAKARLAVDWRATRPELIAPGEDEEAPDSGTRFHFRKARHPLLDPRTVVAIDVEAGETFRVLLITGPNTGGKTVALKTIGLLAMMAQSGLYVTAADDARTSVFGQLFVDIGDDQSIAQSLSTFSSHITNVIAMLQQVDAESLVLIDELGTGTDPQEGSALARAVVSDLVERKPLVVATTHFSEVKAYAYERPEIENASVEFDVETLSPTYKLLMGVPGQSNALAIAGRLGMPDRVLDQARTFLNPDALRVDALLADVLRKRAGAERELAEAARLRQEAEALASERQSELEEARQLRFQAFDEARLEAEQLLGESRRALRRLQRASTQPQPATPAAQSEAPAGPADVAEIASTATELKSAAERTRTRPVVTTEIREGDRVRIRSLDQEGTVVRTGLSEIDVQLGTLRITRPREDLLRIGGPPAETPTKVRVNASSGFVPFELDLRGYRYADVEPELDRYLDAAMRASLPFVRIIHGRGSGALRKGVSEYLRGSPIVERFAAGKDNEGGDGVTVVHFRD